MRYWWWTPRSIPDRLYPGPGPYSLETIREQGVGCSGLINLMILHLGYSLPPTPKDIAEEYRGGTLYWEKVFRERGVLFPFDYKASYPLGTLFFRPYGDEKDQGHIAVMAKDPSLSLLGQVIHSYVTIPDGTLRGEIIYTILGKSHFGPWAGEDGYCKWAILPGD